MNYFMTVKNLMNKCHGNSHEEFHVQFQESVMEVRLNIRRNKIHENAYGHCMMKIS